MSSSSGLVEAKLRVAEIACDLFIQRGTTRIKIDELVEVMGISPRTFHRYFPNKADLVGPVFQWTTQVFNNSVAQEPPIKSLTEVFSAAFKSSLGGKSEKRTHSLFPLVFENPAMWSVFLRYVHNGERTLIPLLAPRLGLVPESSIVQAVAAAAASSTRIALEDMVNVGCNPQQRFEEVLKAFSLDKLGKS